MADESDLPNAVPGDALTPADLQKSFDWLMALADELGPLAQQAADVETAQAVGRTQTSLRGMAAQLVFKQIDLVAGEARISAAHLDSAVAFADGVVRQVADTRLKLKRVADVITFFGAVLTGDGGKIVRAAVQFKNSVEAA